MPENDILAIPQVILISSSRAQPWLPQVLEMQIRGSLGQVSKPAHDEITMEEHERLHVNQIIFLP